MLKLTTHKEETMIEKSPVYYFVQKFLNKILPRNKYE